MAPRTPGLLPLPGSRPALAAELERLDRELGRLTSGRARRILAMERRRVLVRLEQLEAGE